MGIELIKWNAEVKTAKRNISYSRAVREVRSSGRGELEELIRRLEFFTTACHARRNCIELMNQELEAHENKANID